MLNRFDGYEETSARFEWRIPAQYNIGVDACDKWADGSGRLAVIQEYQDGRIERYTFDVLTRWSDGFAHALRATACKGRPGRYLSVAIGRNSDRASGRL